MFCGKCGSKNRYDSRYCTNCGYKLDNPRTVDKSEKRDKVTEDTIKINPVKVAEESKRNTQEEKDLNENIRESDKKSSAKPIMFIMLGLGLVILVGFLIAPMVKNIFYKEPMKQEAFNENEKSEDRILNEDESSKKEKRVEESSNEKDSDYVMPLSSTRYLTKDDLSKYNKKELALIRNEIYARHGYEFESEYYRKYFEKKDWYKPSNKSSESDFNEYEKANVSLIRSLENK